MKDQSRKRIAIFLTNSGNPHQQHLKTAAEEAAAKMQVDLTVYFAGSEYAGSAVAQFQQIYQAVSIVGAGCDAVIVHPVSGPGSDRIVRDLARKGLPCLIINREFAGFEALRREFPTVPICCIAPDQVEVGRIQGRQFMQLQPGPGLLLYVQGPALATAAQQRLTGMLEVLRSSKIEEHRLAGEWLAASAAKAVESWFSLATLRLPDIIGCQNDSMAIGVVEALDRVATARGNPAIRRIPVTGCDGAEEYGVKFVRQGKLTATVVLESPIGPAFSVLGRYFQKQELPPPAINLSVRSLPELAKLTPVDRSH